MYTVVSDYYGTGEGRTLMVLFTRGFPRSTHPQYGIETDAKFWALEAFKDKFGPYYGMGAKVYEGMMFDFVGAEFLLTDKLKDSLTAWQYQANLEYYASFHFNFS